MYSVGSAREAYPTQFKSFVITETKMMLRKNLSSVAQLIEPWPSLHKAPNLVSSTV